MNKFERTKAEKDGLDVYPALMRAAEEGYETLDAGDLMRLKWYGLYQHNTKDEFFMLRVKVTQGVLTAEQADVLAWIAETHGRGIIDCTTRQCVQFHWLTCEVVPEVFARLEAVGLTTSGACGDITRNIVGSTLAGLDEGEVVDGQATAEAIHEFFLDNKLYSNLPRKYKIHVAGAGKGAARGFINDLHVLGATHADGTVGFTVRVGGGLSSAPRFARDIDVFASPEETPEVVAAITAIFRDSEENRAKRGRARLKFLVDALGEEGFRAQVVERLGWDPRRASDAVEVEQDARDHLGVTHQKDGRYAVGFCVPVGRLTSDQFKGVIELARKYGTGEVRLTHQQNVLIPHVPAEHLEAIQAEPLAAELPLEPTQFTRSLQSCTGKEFCGLAKTWTKGRVEGIAKFLDEQVQAKGLGGQDLRLHVAGCSSSCAQHQIGDVGLEGVLKKHEGEFVEAYDLRIGGRVEGAGGPRFGDVVLRKIPHWEINETLLRVFALYEEHREGEGETFRAFTDRMGTGWWTEQLTPVEA